MKYLRGKTILVTLILIASMLALLVPLSADTGSRSAADVTTTDIDVPSGPLFVGDNITITATVANLGTENATDVSVAFEAWNHSLQSPIDLGLDETIGTDNGGTDLNQSAPMQVSVSWNTSEAGKEVTAGWVYQINVTATNNSDGNTTNDMMFVQVQFMDTHYLTITDITPSDQVVRVGGPFNISWTVENIGSQPQPSGDTLFLYLDNESVAINSTAISGLQPKEGTSGTFDVETGDISTGNHTFTLELFAALANVTTDNITFTEPNVYIGEMNWTPHNGTVGDTIVVNATIHNNGTADANGVYVRYFVDAPYVVQAFNDTVNVTAGGHNISTFEWNTSDLSAGNHTVKADLGPAWDSYNVTGNVTLTAGGVADLEVDSVVLVPDTVEIGETVNITATISNDGSWPSVPTNVSFRYQRGLNSSTLGQVPISALQPDESEDVYFLWNTSGLEFWDFYEVWVQADPDSLVEEEVLTNNRNNATLYLSAKADLVVTTVNITIGDMETVNVSQGKSATLNIVIENQGAKNSVQTTAEIYLDNSPTPLEDLKIFGLAVGGEYVLQYTWDTTDVAMGEHTFTVIADADENNTEIDETNNELELTVNVLEPEGMAELVVLGISVDPEEPSLGDHVVIEAQISNNGTEDAVNVTVQFSYIAPGGNVEIDSLVLETMTAGEERTVTTTWMTGRLATGNYNLNVSLDPLNEIREADRSNNYKYYPISIAPGGPGVGSPDLRITGMVLDPEKPDRDEEVTITVTVENLGDGDAPQVRVVFFVDDVETSQKSVENVAADGGSEQVTFDWKADGGMHELRFMVYEGTSAVHSDQDSKVVDIEEEEGRGFGDATPILIAIIVLLIIAIAFLAFGAKGGEKKESRFIEDEYEEDLMDDDILDEEE